jgi:ribosomal protein S18 acetylase RimI-like enzyme
VTITKTKKMESTALENNILTLRKALFDDMGKDKDVCAGLPAFMKYSRNGLDLDIKFKTKLSRAEVDWSFDIIKDNMEGRYDMSGYGWDDEDKHMTLTENGARFLVIREWPEEDDAQEGNMVGIAHFRFSVTGEYMDTMAGEPSLILWDLHIDEDFQRRGLGKHVLTLLEFVAKREGMRYVSVPVMLKDDVSLAWVRKAGGGKYQPDTSLRSLIDFDPEMEGFEVFSKELVPPRPASAPVSASVSAPAADSADAAATPAKAKEAAKGSDLSPTSVFDLGALAAALPPTAPAEAEQEAEAEEQEAEAEEEEAEAEEEGVELPLEEAICKLQDLFFDRHQREPTREEVDQWRAALSADGGADQEEGKGSEGSEQDA